VVLEAAASAWPIVIVELTARSFLVIELTAWTLFVIIEPTAGTFVVVVEAATRFVVIVELTAWSFLVIELTARTLFVIIEPTAGTFVVIIEPTAGTFVVVVKTATGFVVIVELTTGSFFIIELTAGLLVVMESALTSRGTELSLFPVLFVTVTVGNLEGLVLQKLFFVFHSLSGTRTLTSVFVLSHYVIFKLGCKSTNFFVKKRFSRLIYQKKS
jgi:hypothetical protein